MPQASITRETANAIMNQKRSAALTRWISGEVWSSPSGVPELQVASDVWETPGDQFEVVTNFGGDWHIEVFATLAEAMVAWLAGLVVDDTVTVYVTSDKTLPYGWVMGLGAILVTIGEPDTERTIEAKVDFLDDSPLPTTT